MVRTALAALVEGLDMTHPGAHRNQHRSRLSSSAAWTALVVGPARLKVSERQHHLGLRNDMILPQWANGGPDREELGRMPAPLMGK